MNINDYEKERTEALKKISGIKSMRKGVLNEYHVPVNLKNGETVKRGPYYVLSSKGPKGKTKSESVPAHEAKRMKTETENYKEFRRLSEEYIEICERISKKPKEIGENDGERGKKNKKSR
jgi:hypothetical protein